MSCALKMKSDLIAPCGMNCAVCVAYFGYTMLEEKRKSVCPGCRPRNKECAFLKRHCALLSRNEVQFCSDCDQFPCMHLKRLDNRYRAKYNTSMIDNLNSIRNHGMEKFLYSQAEKHRCPKCGETLCVHTNRCYNCSTPE